ncbi:hypothetical protein BO94DRAFT_530837 [Aspergillus sclerotioniger CBS 115572]|uniref:Uncharacterized protein n=1 Tax=Aspergillus sclerotioniger CBS 115572 TaxID=1450535 RepID=A0A317X8Q5_9EURO|nr:hypothetical protein BO94DRAFT_530837 [Aspergillus sclerotioniger CBS 115572]PWY94939.1 hypothetical protein BO94DRAFT_530837 [Aspergillus sclerotioniger CBS 115572]
MNSDSTDSDTSTPDSIHDKCGDKSATTHSSTALVDTAYLFFQKSYGVMVEELSWRKSRIRSPINERRDKRGVEVLCSCWAKIMALCCTTIMYYVHNAVLV